jgi:hypothetical protein
MSEAEEFLGIRGVPPPSPPSEVPTRQKAIMVFSSWIVAFLITCPDPRCIVLVPMFPLGLIGVLHAVTGLEEVAESANIAVILGWVLFAGTTIAAMVARRKGGFYRVWIILTILLLANGAGCHVIFENLP